MKATYDFADRWGDTKAITNLRNSDKGPEVQKAAVENHLKDMAMRFERSPNPNTLKLWASDIIEVGYQDWMVKEICKGIPFSFEKHPTLTQIMGLLRPYLTKVGFKLDELTDLTHRCYPHLKAKFIALADEETFNNMTDFYAQHEPSLKSFSRKDIEMCVLGDWVRSYLKDGNAIMAQRVKTIEAIERRDYEYFTRSYRNYARDNKL